MFVTFEIFPFRCTTLHPALQQLLEETMEIIFSQSLVYSTVKVCSTHFVLYLRTLNQSSFQLILTPNIKKV